MLHVMAGVWGLHPQQAEVCAEGMDFSFYILKQSGATINKQFEQKRKA
jgi:hypothetical protein